MVVLVVKGKLISFKCGVPVTSTGATATPLLRSEPEMQS